MIPHDKFASRPGQAKQPCMGCETPSYTLYCDLCCGGSNLQHIHDQSHEDHAPARGRHVSAHLDQGNSDHMAREAVKPSRYRYTS